MAELGEWNRKGSALSDATAQKEYGVSEDFIVNNIKSGKLEYREGRGNMGQSISQNPEESA